MKTLQINSPKYGIKEVLLDDEDYEKIKHLNWCVNKDKALFYVVSAKGHIRIHRMIMGLGPWKEDRRIIDHADGNPLNNLRSNLRIATNQQNNANIGKLGKNNTSIYKGINFNKATQLWKASIIVNGKFTHLGYFDIELEAAVAYNIAAKAYFKEFAYLNNIEGWETIIPNKRIPQKTSQYIGVFQSKDSTRWETYVVIDGKTVNRRFYTELEAAIYYNQMSFKLHKENAKLNNIPNWQNIKVVPICKNRHTQYRGVKKYGKHWKAEIMFNKVVYPIGLFITEMEAALAYNKKAIELLGNKAKLNIIE